MKRLVFALVAVLVLSVGFVSRTSASSSNNYVPNGPHFTLNIHGVNSFTGKNGNNQNDIFVPLVGKCTIQLNQAVGYDFQVTQPNCLTADAQFTLPAPCSIDATTGLCSTSTTIYSVYARVLGQPGGQIQLTPCAIDPTLTGNQNVCSLNSYLGVRGTGQSKWTNATSSLLFITACVAGKMQSVPLFSSLLQNYTWSVDNTGARLTQLRFYQVPSVVPVSSGAAC
jgi:hypothetical protein